MDRNRCGICIASYLVCRFAIPYCGIFPLDSHCPPSWSWRTASHRLSPEGFPREFGSDLLAGLSIVTSAVIGEYLAGSIVVLMLSGGTALEQYATRRASAVLGACRSACQVLAVLVIATPCPLLLAVPVAIIAVISIAASRGIIIEPRPTRLRYSQAASEDPDRESSQ